jgi:type I restriction enzyme M protein
VLSRSRDPVTSAIFADAETRITDPYVLAKLIREINQIEWHQMDTQVLGDIYEGILERNAQEQKSGAGQYFTPRSVVGLMVRALSPKVGELVQDPATGTGGFLVSAAAHARQKPNGSSSYPQIIDARPTYFGVELVPSAFRLCLMNLSLHGVPAKVVLGNTLGPVGMSLPRPDVILTNPPFGSRRGADRIERPDLAYQTSNKQLAFLQHVYRTLKPGGRAAIVVPDGVLFDSGIARSIRREMLRTCNVHTILQLPIGLFYAQAIKTNVLFLKKPVVLPSQGRDATRITWIYDARTGTSARAQPAKTGSIFADFERIYPSGQKQRQQIAMDNPRFTGFTRAELRQHHDRLDLTVSLPDENKNHDDRDPAKSLYMLRLALTEALDLVDQLEADLLDGRPTYEP